MTSLRDAMEPRIANGPCPAGVLPATTPPNGGGSHGGDVDVQTGLEPIAEALTSTDPSAGSQSRRSKTAFTQARSMINNVVDLTCHNKNPLILVRGPEITVRPVATRLPTRDDVQ